MEEVVQSANQSAETNVTTEEPAATAPVTTQETITEPQGIKVKYNHEERVISHDEAPTWIQKGLNYDKLQERTTQFESHSKALERIARLEGFEDIGAYMRAIDEAERRNEIESEARRLGVDPSVIMEHLAPLRQQVSELTTEKQKYEQLQQQITLQQEVSAVRQKYPDFDQYKQQIVEIVEERGYRIEDAYLLASYQDKISRITKETEANTIRNLQQNADSSPGALGGDAPDTQSGYLSMTPAERKAFREKVRNG